MADKICPKCNKKSEDAAVCKRCGINFDEYETSKQEKFIQIRVLLSENKFQEAKELAEKLPTEFPDNRTDFLLLLSNINRDISIVEKYKQAKKSCDDGDFSHTALLLRNIKAFDHNLNDKVISLRRKVERYLQNEVNFTKAVELFLSGKHAESKMIFNQIHGFDKQDEVTEYLEKIKDIAKAFLGEAIECIRTKQFDVGLEKFAALQSAFPDMEEEVDGYVAFLAKRIDIKNNIFNAAKLAKKEKRFLEAKVLYSFLGIQFPEFLSQVQPHLKEIGQEAVISMADIEESALIEFSGLGLDVSNEGQVSPYASEDSIEYVAADVTAPDSDKDGNEDIVAVASNRGSAADTIPAILEIDGEGVADFSF